MLFLFDYLFFSGRCFRIGKPGTGTVIELERAYEQSRPLKHRNYYAVADTKPKLAGAQAHLKGDII